MLKLMDKINLPAEKGNIIWEIVEIKDYLAKHSQYCLYYNLPLKLFLHIFFFPNHLFPAKFQYYRQTVYLLLFYMFICAS